MMSFIIWHENPPHMNEPSAQDLKVSAVIPCLNEEKTITLCIDKATKAIAEMNVRGEVIVSDNGSTDKSVELSTAHGARVVNTQSKGYGAALMKGIESAKGEIIVMADADDSYDWSDLSRFVDKVDEGYDLVMGNRFKGHIEVGAMPHLHRYLGNPVLSYIARLVFKIDIGDFHCGMRGFKKDRILELNLKSTGMEFATEMVANAARKQLNIAEIPANLYVDKRDRPPHLRSFRDGWRHLRFILTYGPDHLFLIPGLAFLLLGLLFLLFLSLGPITVFSFYFGIHYLALACLSTIVGYNILWMGILAKAMVASKFPILRTRFVNYFLSRFSLEYGLISGLLMISAGALIDLSIFFTWIKNIENPMEDTIHPAFTATTLIALGVTTAFSSFLLSLQKSLSETTST